MFEIVKSVVDEWNPYELLPNAPSDEYDSETIKISQIINKSSNVVEIADIISRVFSKSFNENLDIQKCVKPAEKIYELLNKHKNIK